MSRRNKTKPVADVNDTDVVNSESVAEKTAEIPASLMTPKQIAVKTKPEPTEASIYIGPTIPDAGLVKSTVFRSGKLPAHVQHLLNDCAALKSLIVPVSMLAAAEAKLKQTASVERARYEEARKHFSKGAN
jgi:hypothetical protein